YGGSAALSKVTRVEAVGHVVPAMRAGAGTMTRVWRSTDNLRVEIAYPDKTEVRALEDGKGTNNGRASNAMELDAMRLQAARLALPLLLARSKGALRDLGTHDGVRSIEIALEKPLTMTVDVDPATFHIVRTVGKSNDVAFSTAYSDFRTVNGLL